jgi:hypothetical protein
MKICKLPYLLALLVLSGCTIKNNPEQTERDDQLKVRGWNILSDDLDKGILALNSTEDYGINHLPLSHKLIMDLQDVRNEKKLSTSTQLMIKARQSGIKDIFVWDMPYTILIIILINSKTKMV